MSSRFRPPRRPLLEAAAQAYDRLQEATEQLKRDGSLLDGRYGPRSHPAVAVARDSSQLMGRLLKQLDVSLEEHPVRPPRHGEKPGPKPRWMRAVGE